jgi:hypothetical protein
MILIQKESSDKEKNIWLEVAQSSTELRVVRNNSYGVASRRLIIPVDALIKSKESSENLKQQKARKNY